MVRTIDKRTQRICAWCMPIFVVGFLVSWAILAGYVPPHSPVLSPDEVAAFYNSNPLRIRLGLFLAVFSIMPMILWGAGLAAQTMRVEKGIPVFSFVQIGCVAIGALTGVIDMTVWAVAGYRPETSPELVRMFHDFGWFLFEFTTPPFTLWAICVGLPILLDRSPEPIFQRWVGYFCLFCALGFSPTDLVIFFKQGPFAWNGLFAFYLPMTIFFIWMITMHVLNVRIYSQLPDESPSPMAT